MSDLIEQTEALAHRLVDNESRFYSLDDISAHLLKCAARMRELEAQRNAARATRIAVIEREIEATRAATIERCKQAIRNCPALDENGYICTKDEAIRALKPSGETQSEKPVNPYLLGGSSTQSEG